MSDFWERNDYRALINTLIDSYEHDKNPMHYWEALSLLENANIPIPQQIVEYLIRSAQKMMEIDTAEYKAKGDSEKVFNEIRHALGIDDLRLFTKQTDFKRVIEVADAVREERRKAPRGELINVYDTVAQAFPGLSEATVKRYYEIVRRLEKRQGGAS